MTWRPNPGHNPYRDAADALSKRVFVRLRNGIEPAEAWPASTGRAQTTRWSLSGHGFDIVEWRVG